MKNFKEHAPLAFVFALQFFCMVFFLGDELPDGGVELADGQGLSDRLELLIAIVLAVSVLYSGYQLIQLLGRNQKMEDQLRVASGAFADLLDEYFDRWGLTPSERDVALLAIKGFSIADMARVRDTKEGTIKAQCNALYKKAGVSGRPQLLSLFIDDLIADELVEATKKI